MNPLQPPALIGLVALTGCVSSLPEPQPEGIAPDHGYSGVDNRVVITGSQFYPQIHVDATGRQPDTETTSFRAWLSRTDPTTGGVETHELDGVSLVDYHTLGGVVPATAPAIPQGIWDLVVASPNGSKGRLASAYQVNDSLADHLAMSADTTAHEVFQPAYLHIQLEDVDGNPVLESLDVDVTAETGDGGPVDATFGVGGLVNQALLTGTSGITGSLQAGGSADLTVSVGTPGQVVVTVKAANARSGIAPWPQLFVWSHGAQTQLKVHLTSDPLNVVAGDPFPVTLSIVDQFGNLAPDETATVILRDTCGTWTSNPTVVHGSTSLEAVMKTITGGSCPSTSLVTLIGPPETEPRPSIIVNPAAVSQFAVEPVWADAPSIAVAGDLLDAFVTPEDPYGNRVRWSGDLTVTDTLGGVAPSAFHCIGTSPILCAAQPTRAGSDVRLQVSGTSATQGDVAGASSPFTVVPGEPGRVQVVASGPATAGDPLDVAVTLEDQYGNRLSADQFDPSTIDFADDNGPIACTLLGQDADAVARFSCTLFTASGDDEIVAQLPTLGLVGASDPFAIQNGPLASVEVTTSASTVIAGDSVGVDLVAYDAFGNAYVAQSDAVLILSDDTGTVTPGMVSLDADGTVHADVQLLRAGTTVIDVSQSANLLGASSPITVQAGPPSALSVALPVPWAWVGRAVAVEVAALDAYGNPTSLDATATVSSRTGAFSSTPVTLVAGAGSVDVAFSGARLDERVDAAAPGLVGSSDRVVVAARCAPAGPVAALEFGGQLHAVACHDDVSGSAQFVASLGHSAGSPTLFGLAVQDGISAPAYQSTGDFIGSTSVIGQIPVRALVVDAAGCGSETASTAWVGRDDGTATGPLVVQSDAGSVPLQGTAKVTVAGATDCAGDPAAAPLLVRADRGVITDGVPTGHGLEMPLSTTGNGQVTLSAAATTGGTATIVARSTSGSASGSAQIALTGDDRRPTVWEQSPSGLTTGPVDSIVLRFSEDLLPSSVIPANFAASGPGPVNVVDAILTGDTVTLTLDNPVDAGLGAWTITALSSSGAAIRDLAGNKLDGAWNGTASSFTGLFGAIPSSAPNVSGCALDTAIFRPDGDPGLGAEADVVHVGIVGDSAPEWWVTSVFDGAGALLRRDVFAATGPTDGWVWDGRDATERIVDPGVYRVVVEADDGSGNRDGTCTSTVTVGSEGP